MGKWIPEKHSGFKKFILYVDYSVTRFGKNTSLVNLRRFILLAKNVMLLAKIHSCT